MQCATCHTAGGTGGSVGPDLSQIGKKYTKALILENIVEPSKTIDPQYVTYVVETAAGQILTGVLVRRDDREVVLRDATDKELHVPAKEVAGLVAAKKSIMPEQLLRDLTAEQAADLLEFLASLR